MTLILNGTDNSASTPAVTGATANTGIYYPNTSQVAVSTNGTQALLVDASQNVGIGTGSPTVRLTVSGAVSATGNITGNYILGNGSQLTGISGGSGGGANIANGTSNVTVVTSGGNVTVGIGGTSNVAVFATTGEYITGLLSASGNVNGGNLITAALVQGATVSSSGNVIAVGVAASGNISTTGNVQGGNFVGAVAATTVSASGNVNGGNLISAALVQGATVSSSGNVVTVGVAASGNISATANVQGGNGVFTTIVSAASHTGTIVSITGNITAAGGVFGAGNISTTGNVQGGNFVGAVAATTVSASGQITGSQFNGSGAGLTSIPGANVTGTVPSATSATTAGTVTTAAQPNITSLGNQTSTLNFNTIPNIIANALSSGASAIFKVAGSTGDTWQFGAGIVTAGDWGVTNVTRTANPIVITGGTATPIISVTGSVSVTGNITAAGGVFGSGNISTTGNVQGGNFVGAVAATTVSASGNVTGGNLITAALVQGATVSSSGNVVTVGVAASGNISATANVQGGNGVFTTIVSAASHTGTIVSVTGNITAAGGVFGAGNISTTGNVQGGNFVGAVAATTVSASGQITGSQFNGSGAGLSSIPGANVTGTVPNATTAVVAGTVTTAAQGNITSVGQLTNLNVAGDVGVGTNSPKGRLAVIPNSNPTTVATANTLTLCETSNNSAYQLRLAYAYLSNVYTGVIDAVQNSLGAPLSINPTGGQVGINGSPVYKFDVGIANQAQSATNGSNGLIRNATAADLSPFTQARIIVYGGAGVDTGNWGYFAYDNSASMRIVQGKTGAGGPLIFGTTSAIDGTGTFTDTMRLTGGGALSVVGNITGANISATSLTGSVVSMTGQIISNDIITGSGGVVGKTVAAQGYGVRVIAATTDANATIQFVNTAQNVQWATITSNAVNSLVLAATNVYAATDFTAAGAVKGASLSTTGTITSSSGTGIILNATNAGMELGSGTATNTPYIDFHTTGNAAADYDFRIIASGGSNSATNATGTLQLQGALITATGNVTVAGQITVNSGSNATAIINGAANATGNIGSSTTYFNRLFAQATTALYADLAEMYTTDAEYQPGTVMIFGGTQEVTISTTTHDYRVAGVVSTNPAHIMNSGLEGNHVVAVALTGRVPVSVVGNISPGDRVVTSSQAGVAEALDMTRYQPGVIIGKALQSHTGDQVGVIEVVVGRL